MKPWNETGENEILEQCPCCLGSCGYGIACKACFGKHYAYIPCDTTIEMRRSVAAIGERERVTKQPMTEDPEAKVWGVWVTGFGAPSWCGNGKDDAEFSQGPWPRSFADELARSMSARNPECRYEVRRFDQPKTVDAPKPGTPRIAADWVDPGPPDLIHLDELARALFDADESMTTYLLERVDGCKDRLPAARQRAWDLDQDGLRTKCLAVVERVRANRAVKP